MGKSSGSHTLSGLIMYSLTCSSLVSTGDILTIISLLIATVLGLGAIWATRRYNSAARGNAPIRKSEYLKHCETNCYVFISNGHRNGSSPQSHSLHDERGRSQHLNPGFDPRCYRTQAQLA